MKKAIISDKAHTTGITKTKLSATPALATDTKANLDGCWDAIGPWRQWDSGGFEQKTIIKRIRKHKEYTKDITGSTSIISYHFIIFDMGLALPSIYEAFLVRW